MVVCQLFKWFSTADLVKRRLAENITTHEAVVHPCCVGPEKAAALSEVGGVDLSGPQALLRRCTTVSVTFGDILLYCAGRLVEA